MQASLSPERWDQIQQLFDEVIDLDREERAARLDEACHDDLDLRGQVESLLDAYEQADDLLHDVDQMAFPPSGMPLDATPSHTGVRVSHYEVIEKLGGGGMGVVYTARDTGLDRLAALKFLPPHLSANAHARARFIHEAKAASALDHLNICTIYEIGETDDGQLFIAMACYDGLTLKKKIKNGALSLDEALGIAVQMARGLSKAHGKGIVHRDIKPANVMVTSDGVVKILDFGLAKMADVQLTKTGTTMGTVAYMSPEQAQGEAVDARTDVWSLGVVLYEMLTGARPFRGDYDQAIIYSILHEDPTPMTEGNPGLPEELDHVVAMCLEKEASLRYPSADDLLTDLEVLTQSSGSGSASRSTTSAALRAMQRRGARLPRKAMLAGAGLVAALVLLLMLTPLRQALFNPSGSADASAGRHLALLPFTYTGEANTDDTFIEGLMLTTASALAQMKPYAETPLRIVPVSEVRDVTTGSTPAEKAAPRITVVSSMSIESVYR